MQMLLHFSKSLSLTHTPKLAQTSTHRESVTHLSIVYSLINIFCSLGHGGGLAVGVLAFNSHDLSLNLAEDF